MNCDSVVLATTNPGKVAELAEPLSKLGVRVAGLAEFPDLGEIEEIGATFEENALIKARAVANATGLVAIADDSGLVMDALDGAPGVHSSRYGEDIEPLPGETRDARNIRKLLRSMADAAPDWRACCFVSVLAAAAPNGPELIARGEWQGRLLEAPLGSNGFGYDPVFWDPQLEKSAAQLKKAEKFAVSHRGNAVRGLIQQWPAFAALLATL